MAASVIDALLVTLGLDASAYVAAKDKVTKSQKDLEKNAITSGKRIDDAAKKSDNEAAKRAKEADARARAMAAGFTKVRNETLAMFTAFTGGVGLASFIKNTVVSASQVGKLADNLNMTTQRIGAWQQASERAGGTADGILSQLKESQQAVANFKIGRGASDGMQEFFRMGGNTADIKDANTYLLARADIVKRLYDVDPGESQRAASAMGVSDDQFNLMKQGSVAINKLLADREKYAKFTRSEAADADALRIKMLDLKDAFVLSGTKLVLSLAPALETVMTWFGKLGDWINENRDAIGDWASRALAKTLPLVESLITGLRDADWKGIGNKIEGVAKSIVVIAEAIADAKAAWDKWNGRGTKETEGVSKGWFGMRFGKSADLDKDGATNGIEKGAAPKPFFKPGVSHAEQLGFGASTATLAQRKAHILAEAQKNGYTLEQGAGMVGSLMQENSTLNPATKNSIGATGIAQWLGSRKEGFKKQFGKDVSEGSFEEQVKFMFDELRTTEARAGKAIRGAKTPEEAARLHSEMYERPGKDEANIPRRQANARAVAESANAVRAGGSSQTGGSVSTSSNETRIDSITINTQATDAAGIARDLKAAVSKYSFASQANTGLA